MQKIFLEYIGAITVSFNSLETFIKNSVAELLDKNDINKGLMICNEYFPFGRLIEVYRTLFEYKTNDPKAIKLFNKLIQSCKAVAERRNTLIHSIYLPKVQLEQTPNVITVETIGIKFKKDTHIAEIINEEFFKKIHLQIEDTLKIHEDLKNYLKEKVPQKS